MPKKALTILLALFILSAQSSPLFGEPAAAKDTPEEWNPPSVGPITTWTAPLCGQGQLLVQPFFWYNHTRGTFDSGGDYRSLPAGDKKSQYQEMFFSQLGITDRFEVAGQGVYQQNYVKEGETSAHSDGFGDTYLYLRYCVLEEQADLPHITVINQLKFATGKYQKADPDKLGTDLMGTGSFDHGYGIILTKKFKPLIVHADILYSFPQNIRVDDIKTDYADYLNYDFGFEYFLPKGFNLMLEFNGFTQADRKEDGERIPGSANRYFTFSPGIGWANDTVQLLVAYQRTLAGTNTDANDSVIATFTYTF